MLRQVAKAAAVARDGPGEVDLSALGLHEMAASLPDYVRMVAAGERGFASAFEEMTRVEVAAREVRITNQRIRSSGFPYVCVSSRGFEQKEHRKLSSLSIGSAHAF